jgi:glutathione S-transferase
MQHEDETMSEITLYGSALSLYTGRARSYLIKAGLAYREVAPTTPYYAETVVPKAGGRRGVPTLETETGAVIRDGAAIIDHYEAKSGHGFSPRTPKQKVLSRLFDVIGAEGLLRPAMHYRWNFPDQNQEFLTLHFADMMPRRADRMAMAERAMNAMRNATQMFGAVPGTLDVVEALYIELLDKLNAHFTDQPYLLGGKPSIGDFGMMAPLYAHLGRDPKPLSLMQEKAMRLFRWVERMNRPELDVGEFEVQDGAYLEEDTIPDTLIQVLKLLAEDFVPETQAAADCINAWIDTQETLEPGTIIERGVGLGTFEARGVTINAMAQPYRFYLLKRVQDAYAAMDAASKVDVDAMLAACDMSAVLDIRLSREIGIDNNREVWL